MLIFTRSKILIPSIEYNRNRKNQPIFLRNSFHSRSKMTQNKNDPVLLIFVLFFFTQNRLLSNCTTNYRTLRITLEPSTLPPPRPLNVVLINIHPGRRGAQQTENMNLDNLQSWDPFIARPTFPSRKRRRSGYIIIKVSRVFETTNDILFFLFPPRIVFLGQDYKENGGNARSRGSCSFVMVFVEKKKEEEETYICPRKSLKISKFQNPKILILIKCSMHSKFI